jgi:hypothetical protein
MRAVTAQAVESVIMRQDYAAALLDSMALVVKTRPSLANLSDTSVWFTCFHTFGVRFGVFAARRTRACAGTCVLLFI